MQVIQHFCICSVSLYLGLHECTHTPKCVNTGNRGPSFVQPFVIATVDHNDFLCDSNRGPIVPFVIGPRFECVYLLMHTRTPKPMVVCGVLLLLFYYVDTKFPFLKNSLVGYRFNKEFSCGVHCSVVFWTPQGPEGVCVSTHTLCNHLQLGTSYSPSFICTFCCEVHTSYVTLKHRKSDRITPTLSC